MVIPANEAVLTICPLPRASMAGRTLRTARTTARWLSSSIRSHASAGMSSGLPLRIAPTLLTKRPTEGVITAKLGVPWMMADMVAREGPAFPVAAYATCPAVQLALQGIVAALYEREDSGLGQMVESTLVQGQTVYDTFNWISRVLAERYDEGFKQATRDLPEGQRTAQSRADAVEQDGR